MATIKLTDNNFSTEIGQTSNIFIVDFWANWCGPCKMIGPFLEELSQEFDGKVSIGKLNVDENPNVASQFGIQSIPTLLMFKDGNVVDTYVGAAPKQKLASWIQSQL